MIGLLRHRVRIEQAVPAADAGGGAALSWQELATVWARVTSPGGSEAARFHGQEEQRRYAILIRYRTDVDAGMRAVFEGRILEIHSVGDDDGTRRWLTLDCRQAA